MKTITATLFALVFAAFSAQAKGPVGTASPGSAPVKIRIAQHHLATWQDYAIVFGQASTADAGKISYEWAQLEGPTHARIEGANTPTLFAMRMQPGTYCFRLTATSDTGTISQDEVTVKVKAPIL